MCGIIGVLSQNSAQDLLLQALQRMEYRGYDSAGICVLEKGVLHVCKEQGKLKNLRQALISNTLEGSIGIGHTRWATHGEPSVENAHPHCSENIAVVHNGIIENYLELKKELSATGANFLSQTDSEVIPNLITKNLKTYPNDEKQAWLTTLQQLTGAYAIAAVNKAQNDRLWFARKGSPLLLGRGELGVLLASDALAIAGNADDVIYLEEGEWGYATASEVHIFSVDGEKVTRDWQAMPATTTVIDKGPYAHFMQKEIHEQPKVLADILQAYVLDDVISFPEAEFIEKTKLPERIVMVACGTSYHSALTARYWLERYLQISVEVDVASEYRYRDPVIGPNTWLITLSQSGETADTLEALRLFKSKTPDNLALAICNVPHASLVRESDGLIQLHAGPEIGVASTKAYTAQLAVLALFAMKLAAQDKAMSQAGLCEHLKSMSNAVGQVSSLLTSLTVLDRLASMFMNVHGALYLGRGPCYPLALEGALKLKEISYLHAEGYAAGEMKHGPIALIDENLPVVVLAMKQYHLEKVISNLREVQARGAKVILLTDMSASECPDDVDAIVSVPEGDYFTAPILAAVPLQILAYNVARAKGTDVDQPRNLAKSVTVE